MTDQLIHHPDDTLEVIVRRQLKLSSIVSSHYRSVSLSPVHGRETQSSRPMRLAAVKAGTSSSCRMNRANAMEVTKDRQRGPIANE